MAFEKRYRQILPRFFVSDGRANGEIELLDTVFFKVKQNVVIQSDNQPNLELEVKAVLSSTILIVGPRNSNIRTTTNLSSYLTSQNAKILAAEQVRPGITEVEIHRAVFEEEPTVAYRSVLVDKYGSFWDKNNRLPVDPGTINVSMNGASSPTVEAVNVPNANQQVMLTIPANSKRFCIKSREGNCKLLIRYEENGDFLTVNYGCFYEEKDLVLSNLLNVYVETTKPNQIIELVTWE